MAASFDYFVGALKCPNCGAISPADDSTNIQTKLQRTPSLQMLGVGTRLDFDTADVETAGYVTITPPTDPESFVLLETWECPACGSSYNWAAIQVHDGVIESITAVDLNRAILNSANYISEEFGYVAQARFNDLEDAEPADLLRAFRARLPA